MVGGKFLFGVNFFWMGTQMTLMRYFGFAQYKIFADISLWFSVFSPCTSV